MASSRVAAALLATAIWTSTAGAARIDCEDTTGAQGRHAAVRVTLTPEADIVAATQNDLVFNSDALSIEPADCVINPEIGPGTSVAKNLTSDVRQDSMRVRSVVVSLDNSLPIPDGALYTCTFRVAPDAALGTVQMLNTFVIASTPDGTRLVLGDTECTITIVTPEPTPNATPTWTPECIDETDCPDGQVCVDGDCITVTPTATPTGMGICTDDTDCPPGQVCVENRCMEATPTATSTATATPTGFCTGDTDCPPGQVCVDHRCTDATPTATPEGACTEDADCPEGERCVDNICVAPGDGEGGGCSCRIDSDPSPGSPGNLLALLLPVVVLWLRRRSRATG